MATALNVSREIDSGTLANNWMFVRGLQSALSTSETNLGAVTSSLRTVIRDECWRHWMTVEGSEQRWNAADFRRFIEAPRPRGCNVSISFVRTLLRESDLAEPFEELIRGTPGGPNNPTGVNQHSEVNRNNITVEHSEPDIIPLPEVPLPRVRDYSREAKTGTSVSYTLRRLKDKAPELHDKVIAGDLTPNAAAVVAGFRKRTITLPVEAEAAVRLIVKHFKGEELQALVRGLANWSGIEIVAPPQQEGADSDG